MKRFIGLFVLLCFVNSARGQIASSTEEAATELYSVFDFFGAPVNNPSGPTISCSTAGVVATVLGSSCGRTSVLLTVPVGGPHHIDLESQNALGSSFIAIALDFASESAFVSTLGDSVAPGVIHLAMTRLADGSTDDGYAVELILDDLPGFDNAAVFASMQFTQSGILATLEMVSGYSVPTIAATGWPWNWTWPWSPPPAAPPAGPAVPPPVVGGPMPLPPLPPGAAPLPGVPVTNGQNITRIKILLDKLGSEGARKAMIKRQIEILTASGSGAVPGGRKLLEAWLYWATVYGV